MFGFPKVKFKPNDSRNLGLGLLDGWLPLIPPTVDLSRILFSDKFTLTTEQPSPVVLDNELEHVKDFIQSFILV